ncbi:hypothetical protein NDU88_002818 [Pleurodeles waltl]|uniref:Small RNA 2'-O-methyltransferase n=1 Tax=Pleurodeles waltl TaxID=8319 RepID=A0AAV7T317_PLEWA|nr:hypothetical protein NDU88_002818 [Pleurodeles waltl]
MKSFGHTLAPLPCDYLQPSTRYLSVTLYKGSVAQKDPVLLNFDMVTGIELIEHLESKELEMFPEVVFGFMAPVRVIISTPNFEYNHLLPKLTLFRHPDHKFEWKREEFQCWSSKVAERYDYTVEFSGVGAPPADAGDIGFCTQIAVFVRNYMVTDEMVNKKRETQNVYKTVFKIVYPSLHDDKYLQIAVVNETMYQVHRIKRLLWKNMHLKVEESHSQQFDSDHKHSPDTHGREWSKSGIYTEAENSTQKRGLEPYMRENKVYVPLAYLFSIPKVKKLCGTYDILLKMIAGKVTLNHDGSAVKVKIDLENENNFL